MLWRHFDLGPWQSGLLVYLYLLTIWIKAVIWSNFQWRSMCYDDHILECHISNVKTIYIRMLNNPNNLFIHSIPFGCSQQWRYICYQSFMFIYYIYYTCICLPMYVLSMICHYLLFNTKLMDIYHIYRFPISRQLHKYASLIPGIMYMI